MKQIQGQISLFDLFSEDDFETMTIERAAELVGSRTGLKFKRNPKWTDVTFEAKKNGYTVSLSWGRFADGIGKFSRMRFLDTSLDKGVWGCGNPAISIDESVNTIIKNMDE